MLFLNGSSLLDQPYLERRAQLEQLVYEVSGFVELSWRQPINLTGGMSAAIQDLARIFSEHIANHQEGEDFVT